MEFVTKYKTYIMGALFGIVAVLVLDYMLNIPAWIVGGVIGASVVPVSRYMDKYYDQAVAKGQSAVSKTKNKAEDVAEDVKDAVDGK